jgi:hypothetical protein
LTKLLTSVRDFPDSLNVTFELKIYVHNIAAKYEIRRGHKTSSVTLHKERYKLISTSNSKHPDTPYRINYLAIIIVGLCFKSIISKHLFLRASL